MPYNQWSEIVQCSLINHTHIEANFTALAALTTEELQLINAFLTGLNISQGQCVKPHFTYTWQIFLAFYTIIGLAGAFGNIYMIGIMLLETSFKRCINYLLFNLCLSNLVKSLVVLPVSLYVLLIAHWRLGSFMCYASPLAQTFPVVVSVMTYLLISIDRYLMLFRPASSNRPPSRRAFVCLIVITWVTSFCMVLPLKTCVRYYDLRQYFGDALKGYGVCAIGFDTRIREINIALFMVIYAIPLLIMIYLMLKSNNELKWRLKNDTRALHDAAMPLCRHSSTRSYLRNSREVAAETQGLMLSPPRSASLNPVSAVEGNARNRAGRTHSFLVYVDHEIGQLSNLLQFNRCLGIMLGLFAFCWAPLQCVMLVCYIIPETPESIGLVDTVFLICTLIGLSSSVTNPALLIYQRKSVQVALHSGLRVLRRFSSSAVGGFNRSKDDQMFEDAIK